MYEDIKPSIAYAEYQVDTVSDVIIDHTILYSFNNVVDIPNVQQIHTEIEIKWVNVKYS